MSFSLRVVRTFVMSINSSHLALLLRVLRIICRTTTRRNNSTLRHEFMSSGLNTLYLGTLRRTLSTTLTRVITITLRHRTVRTSNTELLFLLTMIILINMVMMTYRIRRSINSRVLTNTITLCSNLSRVLKRINVIYRRLLNVLQRAMTTVSRQQVVMRNTSTEIRSRAQCSNLNIRSLRLNMYVRLIRMTCPRYRMNINRRFRHLYLYRSRRRDISILLSNSLLRRFYRRVHHLIRSLVSYQSTRSSTTEMRVIMRYLTLTRRFQNRSSILTIRLPTCILNMTR